MATNKADVEAAKVNRGGTAAAADTDYAHSTGDSQEEPTKDELYERATELDVEGRSSMSKDELAAAVAEASESEESYMRGGKNIFDYGGPAPEESDEE